jgi:Ca-activated chloride channel family protein
MKYAVLSLLLCLSGPTFAGIVEPSIELDYPTVTTGDDIVVYALITLNAPEYSFERERSRKFLNLSLVIDRSGSMDAYGKMSYAKQAAKMLVDRLSHKDRLSIVEYDDQISILWPASRVESPNLIKRKIDGLYPRGMTNLTGGMMTGVEQVRRFHDSEYLHRVILMSDGLANEGITNPYQIRGLVRNARANNVRITTLGLGESFNEDLMQMIAENSGGNYYFVEDPEQMERIYAHELEIMFAMSAGDVECSFRSGRYVNSVEVFGYPSTSKGTKTTISMEDFYSGETRSLLLRISFDKNHPGKVKLGEFEMSYRDLRTGKRRFFDEKLTVKVVEDEELVAMNENKEVVAEAMMHEADRKHEESVRQVEAGQYAAAQASVEDILEELKEKNEELQDEKLEAKIEAMEMEQSTIPMVASGGISISSYTKKRKAAFFKSQKGDRGMYLMQQGDKGFEVENLQIVLKDKGFFKGEIDGFFSDELEEALKLFQKDQNLKQDGIAGPKTLQALGLY